MPYCIVVKPYGGLANRMRVIDSANNLAKEYSLTLKVLWEQSPELNCSFYRLFESSDELEIEESSFSPIIRKTRNFTVKSLLKAGIYLPFGFDKHLLDDEILNLGKKKADLKEIIAGHQKVYIRTTHQFYRKQNSFSVFRPVPEIRAKIEEVTQVFNNATIGLHIRRTDNEASIKFSPLEGFIENMRSEIEIRNSVNFYLATDSPETEQQLKTLFGDRIITRKRKLDRNSEQGIQDALIDLYCLSKTSKIIGSYYSSFSEVAAQVNGMPLHQIYYRQ